MGDLRSQRELCEIGRYAKLLVSGTQEDALAEKSALAEHLRQSTGLELSPEPIRILHFNGLGFAEFLCESPPFARTFAKESGDIILRQGARPRPISCS
jgi:hypothetical protein